MEKLQISLAAARVNAGMTQEEVAKVMKVGKRTIINWEKGIVTPNAATLHFLSEIYKLPVDVFLLPK